MSDLLGIGLSGLAAAQAGLSTAGHNIANVNTPGYSRQQVVFAARPPQFTGGGYIGQGVDISNVRREYSDFLAGQLTRATSDSSQLDAYATQLGTLDNLFGVAILLGALREAGAGEQAAALTCRLPAVGMFNLFLGYQTSGNQFRFGLEADGAQAAPWNWEDLDL